MDNNSYLCMYVCMYKYKYIYGTYVLHLRRRADNDTIYFQL